MTAVSVAPSQSSGLAWGERSCRHSILTISIGFLSRKTTLRGKINQAAFRPANLPIFRGTELAIPWIKMRRIHNQYSVLQRRDRGIDQLLTFHIINDYRR